MSSGEYQIAVDREAWQLEDALIEWHRNLLERHGQLGNEALEYAMWRRRLVVVRSFRAAVST